MPPLRCAAALAVLWLAGCASAPYRAAQVAPAPEAAFRVDGRLSARHGSDAVSANFRWDHAPPRDELDLLSPLGQTVAHLSGDTSVPYARFTGSDGKTFEAADWATLTQRALGFPLPVAGLSAWIRGRPHAGSRFDAEADDAGRPIVLRQDGWEITLYYPDLQAIAPSRLRLSYPEVEVRLAIDRMD